MHACLAPATISLIHKQSEGLDPGRQLCPLLEHEVLQFLGDLARLSTSGVSGIPGLYSFLELIVEEIRPSL